MSKRLYSIWCDWKKKLAMKLLIILELTILIVVGAQLVSDVGGYTRDTEHITSQNRAIQKVSSSNTSSQTIPLPIGTPNYEDESVGIVNGAFINDFAIKNLKIKIDSGRGLAVRQDGTSYEAIVSSNNVAGYRLGGNYIFELTDNNSSGEDTTYSYNIEVVGVVDQKYKGVSGLFYFSDILIAADYADMPLSVQESVYEIIVMTDDVSAYKAEGNTIASYKDIEEEQLEAFSGTREIISILILGSVIALAGLLITSIASVQMSIKRNMVKYISGGSKRRIFFEEIAQRILALILPVITSITVFAIIRAVVLHYSAPSSINSVVGYLDYLMSLIVCVMIYIAIVGMSSYKVLKAKPLEQLNRERG